jgi:hypothetical protein
LLDGFFEHPAESGAWGSRAPHRMTIRFSYLTGVYSCMRS